MGELEEWKPILKRVGALIRNVVSMYVEQVEQELEKKQQPDATKTYTCKQCEVTFDNRYKYAAHCRFHHN